MKRFAAILLALTMLPAIWAGCTVAEKTDEPKDEGTSMVVNFITPFGVIELKDDLVFEDPENYSLKVSRLSFTESGLLFEMKLENNFYEEMSVSCDAVVLNQLITVNVECNNPTVSKGEEALFTMLVPMEELDKAGVYGFITFHFNEISYWGSTEEFEDNGFAQGELVVKGNEQKSFSVSFVGDVLYKKNDVTITLREVNERDGKKVLKLLVYNATDKIIGIDNIDMESDGTYTADFQGDYIFNKTSRYLEVVVQDKSAAFVELDFHVVWYEALGVDYLDTCENLKVEF